MYSLLLKRLPPAGEERLVTLLTVQASTNSRSLLTKWCLFKCLSTSRRTVAIGSIFLPHGDKFFSNFLLLGCYTVKNGSVKTFCNGNRKLRTYFCAKFSIYGFQGFLKFGIPLWYVFFLIVFGLKWT